MTIRHLSSPPRAEIPRHHLSSGATQLWQALFRSFPPPTHRFCLSLTWFVSSAQSLGKLPVRLGKRCHRSNGMRHRDGTVTRREMCNVCLGKIKTHHEELENLVGSVLNVLQIGAVSGGCSLFHFYFWYSLYLAFKLACYWRQGGLNKFVKMLFEWA